MKKNISILVGFFMPIIGVIWAQSSSTPFGNGGSTSYIIPDGGGGSFDGGTVSNWVDFQAAVTNRSPINLGANLIMTNGTVDGVSTPQLHVNDIKAVGANTVEITLTPSTGVINILKNGSSQGSFPGGNFRDSSGVVSLNIDNKQLNDTSGNAFIAGSTRRISGTVTNAGSLVVMTNGTFLGTMTIVSNLLVNTTGVVFDATLGKFNINRSAGQGHSGYAFDLLGNAIIDGTLKITNTTAQIASPLGSLTLSPSNGNAIVNIDGGTRFKRTQVSVNYTNSVGDFRIGWRYTSIGITNFLNDPAVIGQRDVVIKDELGSASVTNIWIISLGGALIDGIGKTNINSNYGSMRLYNDGVNWFSSK